MFNFVQKQQAFFTLVIIPRIEEKIEIQKFTCIDAQHFDKILSVDEKIKVWRKKWENLGKNSYFLPEQNYSSRMWV